VSDLKKQAEELGIQVDGRWSDAKIQAMIDDVLAQGQPDPTPQPDADPVPEPVDEPQESAEPEAEAETEAGDDALDATEVTITSLIENPMKVFGLRGIGDTAKIAVGRLRDDRFAAKLVRAKEMGMIRLEDHE
jgi:ribosomal protein L12E/L44/L45/RPP1/RPP2